MKRGINITEGLFLVALLLKLGFKLNINWWEVFAPLILQYLIDVFIEWLKVSGNQVKLKLWLVKQYGEMVRKSYVRKAGRRLKNAQQEAYKNNL